MNVERIRQVAAAIRESQRFDLSKVCADKNGASASYLTLLDKDCNTVGCVLGWSIALFASEAGLRNHELLDLSRSQANSLFCAYAGSVWGRLANEYGWARYARSDELGELHDWREVTADQAAEVLERIASGEIEL